jgi:hypothetical protein
LSSRKIVFSFVWCLTHWLHGAESFLRSLLCSAGEEIPRIYSSFCNILFFYGGKLLPPAEPTSRRTTPYQLSANVYSVYSQLPTISGFLLL